MLDRSTYNKRYYLKNIRMLDNLPCSESYSFGQVSTELFLLFSEDVERLGLPKIYQTKFHCLN